MADGKEIRIVISADGKVAVETLSRVAEETRRMGAAAKDTQSSVAGLNTASVNLASSLHVAGVAFDALKKAWNFSREVAETVELKNTFKVTAYAFGVDADRMVSAMQRATNGTVSGSKLMTGALTAMRQGVTSDIETMARLWEISMAKSKEFREQGRTTQEVFSEITSAIATGQGRALVHLGILPEAFGRASNAASLLEKRAALLKDVLDQSAPSVARMNQLGDTTADAFRQLDVAVGQLKGALVDLTPAFLPVIQGLTLMAQAAGTAIKLSLIATGLKAPANPFAGMTTAQLESEKARRETGLAGLPTKDYNQVDPSFTWTPGASAATNKPAPTLQNTVNVAAQREAYRRDLVLISEELKKQKDLSEQKVKADKEAADLAKKMAELAAGKGSSSGAGPKDTTADRVASLVDKANTDAVRAFVAEMAGGFVPTVDKAEKYLISATAAAGGFAVALTNGMTPAGKVAEQLEQQLAKVEKMARGIAAGWGGKYAWIPGSGSESIQSATPESMTRMMVGLTAGLGLGATPGTGSLVSMAQGNTGTPVTADAAKQGKDFGKIFSKEVAESLNQALTDAFRNGNMFEGLTRGITNAIQQAVSQSNPVISSTGGINFGNLGLNFGVSAAMGWLQSPGRLLGGTKVNGGEVPGQADSINQQISNAIAQRDAAQLIGASSDTISRLRQWQPAYAGYSWDSSGDGIFSARTTTYQLNADAANAALTEFASLMSKANQEMRDAEVGHIQLQAVANLYELNGNQLTALKLREQDAQKKLEEIWKSLSPVHTTFGGMLNGTIAGLTPEQKRTLEDAQYQVASVTKALAQFKDAIDNSNKALILRFPGSRSQQIINNPHIDDIILGQRIVDGSLTAADYQLREDLGGLPAVRASSRKGAKWGTTDGAYHGEKPVRGYQPPIVVTPPPVVVTTPVVPEFPAGWRPPVGDTRAPNNGRPTAYATAAVFEVPDETGFHAPPQSETNRRVLSKDEELQIEAVLKEYADTKDYTGRSMVRSRAEALTPLDALDFTGRGNRISQHLSQSRDELATIDEYRREQDEAIKRFSATGDIDQAKLALERWKDANTSYIAKYDEITQEQAEAMATSTEQTKYYEGLLKSSREGWTSLALNQRFLSAAGMTDAHTGLQGSTVSTGMTFYSGYSPDQIKQFAANKQLQKQAWYYGQATATETDIAIREMKARAGGDYGELEAVAKLRHDDAAARVAALSTDLTAAQTALNKTSQAQADYLEKYNRWRTINDTFNQARLDEAQTAIDQAALLKEKQDRARDDILGTLLTNIGEIRADDRRGTQVFLLAGGQPRTKQMLADLRDQLDPESLTLFDALVAETQSPEF